MTTTRGASAPPVASSRNPPRRGSRREFLLKTSGALAAGAFTAYPVISRAAETVNIGALYPVTGSLAQIGLGCVNAAKLAAQMVNDGGGIKWLRRPNINM